MPPATHGAAGSHEAAARLQQQARSELLQRLQFFELRPRCVLDLGAGTCQGTLELARRFRRARTIAVDLSHQMLARAPRTRWWWRRFERVCADAGALPLADASCDLIFSNLMLQACERLDALFVELRRVLRPGGLLLFSSFAPGTPPELRSAWARLDPGPLLEQLPDLPQVAEVLMRSGFIEPVIDVERAREAAGLAIRPELLYGAAFASGEGPAVARADSQAIPLDQVRRRLHARGTPAAENRVIGVLAARPSPSLS